MLRTKIRITGTLILFPLTPLAWGQANPPSSVIRTAVVRPSPPVQFRPFCNVQPPYGQWGVFTRFISGLSSDAYSMPEEQQRAWRNYSRVANDDWKNLKKRYLDRIEGWRQRFLGSARIPDVAFYPFSGPDAANLFAFFPDAREYVLIGLEPPGCIPAVVRDYTGAYFAELRQSLEPAVALGFFRTNDMHREFAHGQVNGVLPLLLFLIAREGYTITNVAPVDITSAGVLTAASNSVRGETGGVSIQFEDGRHGMRTLRYFSVNLQDSLIQRKPGTLKYLRNMPEAGTLIKAASYLMHKTYFSVIRDLILAKSRVVIEDDSGVPFRFFNPAAWDVRLYGSYAEPIRLFASWRQQDLKDAFASRSDIPQLDFPIGYRTRSQSSLLVALRRK